MKKMIGWERQSIEKQGLEIAEIKKCFMQLFKSVHEKITNHEQFIRHIRDELHAKEKYSNKFHSSKRVCFIIAQIHRVIS